MVQPRYTEKFLAINLYFRKLCLYIRKYDGFLETESPNADSRRNKDSFYKEHLGSGNFV